MRYGCPKERTDGIEQGCQLIVWLPVNPDTGETETDILDGRETDNWELRLLLLSDLWRTLPSSRRSKNEGNGD